MTKDPFTLWHEWAEKPLDSMLTISSEIHEAVMALPPEERRDREKVNEAVRDKQERQVREMIERVANAMVAKWRIYSPPSMSPDMPYWRDMARAAIEAMREPTDAMCNACPDIDGVASDPAEVWRAMIDAALSEH